MYILMYQKIPLTVVLTEVCTTPPVLKGEKKNLKYEHKKLDFFLAFTE